MVAGFMYDLTVQLKQNVFDLSLKPTSNFQMTGLSLSLLTAFVFASM